MATHLIFHEVDDVEHWLQSPRREEVFGPIGISVRPFRDPQGSNRVGLIAEIPDMGASRSSCNPRLRPTQCDTTAYAPTRSWSSTRDNPQVARAICA